MNARCIPFPSTRLRRKSLTISRGFLIVVFGWIVGCSNPTDQAAGPTIVTVLGAITPADGEIWLSHEHLLVDFSGGDEIDPGDWNDDEVIETMLPYLEELKAHNVRYFVDPTPHYLGRDPVLLRKLSELSGLHILTNTGFYGARNDAHIPSILKYLNAREMAGMWISEARQGIANTDIRPGFMKIGVDNTDPLDSIDTKLVHAAAMTHLETGLTIASHTGAAKGLWPQLEIIKQHGVSPDAFIWVHAQNEADNANYLKAAAVGCWISLDGLGWRQTKYFVAKLKFLKQHHLLDRVLLSHDAGWYDPQKDTQSLKPYTPLFLRLLPRLKEEGFTDEEVNQLVSINPREAFAVRVRTSE